jgi:hypothetical protein
LGLDETTGQILGGGGFVIVGVIASAAIGFVLIVFSVTELV